MSIGIVGVGVVWVSVDGATGGLATFFLFRLRFFFFFSPVSVVVATGLSSSSEEDKVRVEISGVVVGVVVAMVVIFSDTREGSEFNNS